MLAVAGKWRVAVASFFSCFSSAKMVQHLLQVFTEYEEHLRRNNYVAEVLIRTSDAER